MSQMCEMCEEVEAKEDEFFCETCQPVADELIARDKAQRDKTELIEMSINFRRADRSISFKIDGYNLATIKEKLDAVLKHPNLKKLTKTSF